MSDAHQIVTEEVMCASVAILKLMRDAGVLPDKYAIHQMKFLEFQELYGAYGGTRRSPFDDQTFIAALSYCRYNDYVVISSCKDMKTAIYLTEKGEICVSKESRGI